MQVTKEPQSPHPDMEETQAYDEEDVPTTQAQAPAELGEGAPQQEVSSPSTDHPAGTPLARERSRSRSRERPFLPEERPFPQRAESPTPGSPPQGDTQLSDFDDADMREAREENLNAEAMWAKDKLPPPREHELEFILPAPKSFRQGKSTLSELRELQGSFRFRLLVFPMGTDNTGRPEQIAAFVEVVPPEGTDVRWAFEQVRYQITVVNWKDYRRSATQTDTFTFQRDSSDRGWHRGFLKASEMTSESGWLSENGELCFRAACSARRAMVHMPNNTGISSRRSVGYVGLKNHGATCYMNCLLQTLFHIGRFRHIVYSIDVKENEEQESADAFSYRPISAYSVFY